MKNILVEPGNIVVTNMGAYQHFSIVTDRICAMGYYMLISATKRNGTVQEEPQDIVTQGKTTYVADVKTELSPHQIITNARSQIGKWQYTVATNNCEHFVNWAAGLKVSSAQVKASVGGAAIGIALVGALSENPKFIKFLGGAVALGGIALLSSKAMEKCKNKQ